MRLFTSKPARLMGEYPFMPFLKNRCVPENPLGWAERKVEIMKKFKTVLSGFMAALSLPLSLSLGAMAAEVTLKSSNPGGGKDAVNIDALLLRPKGGGPFPAVVILPACGGMTGNVTENWPRFLNGIGYVTLSVSNYKSRGYGNCAEWTNRNERRRAIVRDAYSALEYLTGQGFVDPTRIAVMGFSEGANAINLVMFGKRVRNRGKGAFNAAIAFYGRCNRLRRYSGDDTPLMQVVPELDEKRAKLCIAMGRTTPMSVKVLKGAYHAFDNSDFSRMREDHIGNTMMYDRNATEKSQAMVKEFLHAARPANPSGGMKFSSPGTGKKGASSDLAGLLKNTVLKEAGGLSGFCGNKRNGRRALIAAARQKLESNGVDLPPGINREVGQALRAECRAR
jgi:dienelactone hydrolase